MDGWRDGRAGGRTDGFAQRDYARAYIGIIAHKWAVMANYSRAYVRHRPQVGGCNQGAQGEQGGAGAEGGGSFGQRD